MTFGDSTKLSRNVQSDGLLQIVTRAHRIPNSPDVRKVPHPNLQVTWKAHRSLEKGLTEPGASFATESQIRSDLLPSTRSVEDAWSINVIFINRCSATHIRVVSAGTNLGDQGYGEDCLTRSVLDENQQKYGTDIPRKHDPRQKNVHIRQRKTRR